LEDSLLQLIYTDYQLMAFQLNVTLITAQVIDLVCWQIIWFFNKGWSVGVFYHFYQGMNIVIDSFW